MQDVERGAKCKLCHFDLEREMGEEELVEESEPLLGGTHLCKEWQSKQFCLKHRQKDNYLFNSNRILLASDSAHPKTISHLLGDFACTICRNIPRNP